jgi:RHS repeat-associated protein
MPTQHFVWDHLSDNILQERDENGAVNVEYTAEPDLHGSIISESRGGAHYHHHYDGNGNTVAMTDANQNVTDSFAYSAFGEVTQRTGTIPTAIQFGGEHGYHTDGMSGAVTVRRRTLVPAIARWISRHRSSHTNLYAYSRNNPVNQIDPTGSQLALLGQQADTSIDSPNEAAAVCQRASEAHAERRQTPLPPFTLSMQLNCADRLEGTFEHNQDIIDLWEQFSYRDCPPPQICCKCCYFLGVYLPRYHSIVLCWNRIAAERATVAEVLLHEGIHALQNCFPLGGEGLCEKQIRKEIEAYFCANQCDHTFGNCLFGALFSSCSLGQCKSEDWTAALYTSLENWFQQTQGQFCGRRGDPHNIDFERKSCSEIDVSDL